MLADAITGGHNCSPDYINFMQRDDTAFDPLATMNSYWQDQTGRPIIWNRASLYEIMLA
jgi:hypothetical protein